MKIIKDKMIFQHKTLSEGRWYIYSFPFQMANIGSEVERAISWKNKKNLNYSQEAVFRALELLFFTIKDPKNKSRLKEIVRLYEVLADYFLGDNQFQSSDTLWHNYFFPFSYKARIGISS